MPVATFKSWSTCDDCGFQGLLIFQTRADEDYSDESALGYLMDSQCPACGQDDPVLVIAEEYQAMLRIATRNDASR